MNYSLSHASQQILIDHNVGRSYFGTNSQPLLSIKCMFNGRARYVADGRREFVVDDASYVILNHGNPYSVEKRSPTPVETFCVFFPAGLSGSVARDLTAGASLLLSDVVAPGIACFNFLEHRRAHGDDVSRHVMRMREVVAAGLTSDEWLEETLLLLLRSMLMSEACVRRRVANLPHARASTRMEVFRRVHTGRDFLHANLQAPFSLALAARAAAMSPYHFLRSFRQVFGLTPGAYLGAERLRRASDLLLRTQLSVTEIASLVGFQSLPSFVNRFKHSFGMPPSRYRGARASLSNPE